MTARMRIRGLVFVVLFPILATGAGLAESVGAASPPLSQDPPTQVILDPLANLEVDALPGTDEVVLALERVPLEAGANLSEVEGRRAGGPLPSSQVLGQHLLYVEEGELVVADSDRETAYAQGEAVLMRWREYRPDAPEYEVRNDSDSCASLLRFSIGARGLAGTLEEPASGPPAIPEPPCGSEEVLIDMSRAGAWPPAPAELFIARATVDPFGALEGLASEGPVGLAIESGHLAIGPGSGVSGRIPAGGWVVLSSGNSLPVWNPSDEPAVALVAGILPAGAAVLSEGGAASEGDEADPGAADVSTYTSPTFGYTLAWDPGAWEVEDERVTDDGRDLLVLDGLPPGPRLYIEGYEGYDGDPEDCVEGAAAEIALEPGMELEPLEDRDGEPVEGTEGDRVFAAYAFTDEMGADQRALVECWELEPGWAVLAFTLIASADDYANALQQAREVIESLELADQPS